MKIMIITSGVFYNKIPKIQKELESFGHEIKLPNSFGEVFDKVALRAMSDENFIKFKTPLLKKNIENVSSQDAVLVLNYDKENITSYIGGATFLEIYDAWRLGKKIFILNQLPQTIFTDELRAMSPIILGGKLDLIK